MEEYISRAFSRINRLTVRNKNPEYMISLQKLNSSETLWSEIHLSDFNLKNVHAPQGFEYIIPYCSLSQ